MLFQLILLKPSRRAHARYPARLEYVAQRLPASHAQASTLSTAAAESAQHKLRSLDGFKPPLASLGSLGKPAEPERPAPADLAMYGVTDELLDFVRSLTYSTFRDFPTDGLPPPTQVLLTHPRPHWAITRCAVHLIPGSMAAC